MTTTHTDKNELFRVREYERLVDAILGCEAFADRLGETAYVVRWTYGYGVMIRAGMDRLGVPAWDVVTSREPFAARKRTAA